MKITLSHLRDSKTGEAIVVDMPRTRYNEIRAAARHAGKTTAIALSNPSEEETYEGF